MIELVVETPDATVRDVLCCDGQLDLPKMPPFGPVINGGPAAIVTVDLPFPETLSSKLIRAYEFGEITFKDLTPDNRVLMSQRNWLKLFSQWFTNEHLRFRVYVNDGRGTGIVGMMRCVGCEVHQRIQSTVSVLPPIRWHWDNFGNRVPYTPQPTWQRITKAVHCYQLAADRYELCAPPQVAKAIR